MNSANCPYKLGLITFSTVLVSIVSVAVVAFGPFPGAKKGLSSKDASQTARTTPRHLLVKVPSIPAGIRKVVCLKLSLRVGRLAWNAGLVALRGELNVVNEVRPEFLRSLLLACCGKVKPFRVERIYRELEAGLSRSA